MSCEIKMSFRGRIVCCQERHWHVLGSFCTNAFCKAKQNRVYEKNKNNMQLSERSRRAAITEQPPSLEHYGWAPIWGKSPIVSFILPPAAAEETFHWKLPVRRRRCGQNETDIDSKLLHSTRHYSLEWDSHLLATPAFNSPFQKSLVRSYVKH